MAVLAAAPALAQSVGSISGMVMDESQRRHAGRGRDRPQRGHRHRPRGGHRRPGGRYALPLLPIGTYTVSAAMSGFQTQERSKVLLEVQQSLALDFMLALVVADHRRHGDEPGHRGRGARSDASLGQLINAQQVAELPLNGRNFVQLALLGPGTVTGRAGSFLAQGPSSEVSYRGSMSVSAQGMRENANDWLYDGVDDNELTAGGVGILPNVDSIREFKVLTHNYLAQYGSRGGTTVLVSSKSGENAFHGTAVRVLPQRRARRPQLLRRCREAQVEAEHLRLLARRPGQARPDVLLRRLPGQQHRRGADDAADGADGADAPGHLHRVVSRRARGDRSTIRRPPASIRRPACSCAIRSRATRFRPTASTRSARRCSTCCRLPTFTDRLGGNYLANPVKTLNDYQGDLRIDHNFSNNDRLFARFSVEEADQYLPTGLPDFGATGGFSSNQTFETSAKNVALSHTHVFRNNLINQFTAGYNRIYNYITSFGYGSNKSRELGIPGANLGTDETSSLTRMTFQNFVGIGDRGFSPFQGGTDVYHYTQHADDGEGQPHRSTPAARSG